MWLEGLGGSISIWLNQVTWRGIKPIEMSKKMRKVAMLPHSKLQIRSVKRLITCFPSKVLPWLLR
jgi:hypothetical protein